MISQFLKTDLILLQDNMYAKMKSLKNKPTKIGQLKLAYNSIKKIHSLSEKEPGEEIRKAVGEVIVCMLNYCNLKGISVHDCINPAHTEFMNRR